MPRSNRSIVATPPGSGAIAVIRVAGPDAHSILAQLFEPGRSHTPRASSDPVAPTTPSLFVEDNLRYGRIVAGGETIDDVIVTAINGHDGPAVDICAHGGVRVVERILGELEARGAPLCEEPDNVSAIWRTRTLVEREAIECLLRAKTERAVRFLAWQRQHLVDRLERVVSLCETDADQARDRLEAMTARFAAARILVEGGSVALVGPPNSGKSTLLNALVGRQAAIVSPCPGTTRDWVTATVEMAGVPMTVADTAGQRGSAEKLEREAMERGRAVARKADLRLVLLDGSQPLTDESQAFALSELRSRPAIPVITKSDLGCAWAGSALSDSPGECLAAQAIHISAQSGDGIDDLVALILEQLGFAEWVDGQASFFTRRQVDEAALIAADLPSKTAQAKARTKKNLIGD